MAEGQIRKLDAEVLAYALMGIADFLGMRWVLWEDEQDTDRVVETVMTMLRSGIACSAPDAVPATKKTARPNSLRGAVKASVTKAKEKAVTQGAGRVRR